MFVSLFRFHDFDSMLSFISTMACVSNVFEEQIGCMTSGESGPAFVCHKCGCKFECLKIPTAFRLFLQNKSGAFRLASLFLPLAVFLLLCFTASFSLMCVQHFVFIPKKACTPSVPCIGKGRSLKINPTTDCVFHIDFGSMCGRVSEPQWNARSD